MPSMSSQRVHFRQLGVAESAFLLAEQDLRSHKIHGDLVLLQYECYHEMAEIQLRDSECKGCLQSVHY